MNKLKHSKQVAVVAAFTEGVGVRGVERLTGVHRDTATRLLIRVGDACATLMNEKMQELPCKRLQFDEQWTLVERKARNVRPHHDATRCGDVWLWSCIDEESRAVPAFHLGKRTGADADTFVRDVALRMAASRVTISTDGLKAYVGSISQYFGDRADFGTLVKSFEVEQAGPGRYSPPRVTSAERRAVIGNPDVDAISTSYIERLHLLNRMKIRRMTRLVDGFSRKIENLRAAITVHYAAYNFTKKHKSLDGATPAMALGITDRVWKIEELVRLAD